jgi:hypothetical protein
LRLLLLTFVPAACFPVLPKSLPQSVVAPWRAVLTVWANITKVLSGSFRAGFALVRAIPVPARPCEEAFHARQVFLDAAAHGSVIPWQHINLLGEYETRLLS